MQTAQSASSMLTKSAEQMKGLRGLAGNQLQTFDSSNVGTYTLASSSAPATSFYASSIR